VHLDGIVLRETPVDHERLGVLHLDSDVRQLPRTYRLKLRREFL
jgi:hypothetical protein